MKKLFRRTLRVFIILISIPIIYVLIALLLGAITVPSSNQNKDPKTNTIFLHTNGVHLDVAFLKEEMDSALLVDIYTLQNERYISFGWGDENFYLNTPTWGNLTLNTAIKALFLKSKTLLHITRYEQKQADWIEIPVTQTEFKELSGYILATFKTNENGVKQMLTESYEENDNFYRANGSYSCFKTCNTRVNQGFKTASLKASFWTPFDFALMNKYNAQKETSN